MAQLLVYTQNYFVRCAIDSLTDKNNSVTYFTNRVQFLACAKVLDNPVLLIDAINKDDENVKWLGIRINKEKKRKVHYLVPLSMLANSFAPGLSLVAEVFHLKAVFFFAWGEGFGYVRRNIHEDIISKLNRTLSFEEYLLIRSLYNTTTGKRKILSKIESNKVYYIRKKKLRLDSSSEFKQFILFLAKNKAMQPDIG